MMEKIRVGIAGYGNIGRGVEKAVNASADMTLAAVFTRRGPSGVVINTPGARVLPVSAAFDMRGDIDVMVLCGGSANDLPEQGPLFAAAFTTVDSFDTHAKIPEYFDRMNSAARDTISVISVGWDPGLFSVMRLLSGSVLPDGRDYTFWGRGVSQGHSDAIRHVEGVLNAIQYTLPVPEAVSGVRAGRNPELTARQKHTRECYVVAAPGADRAKIETEIKSMPNYFADYDTTVHFISAGEFKANHSAMPHGGLVLRSGHTGENAHIMEFSLTLGSNPEFTGSIMAAYARAAVRLHREGARGAKTALDIPLSYLSPMDHETMLKTIV